ncbi:MAG: hypothetical protein P1V81_04375 [Planctomycetota bacterium]|nr:hypothetical protein [Planctomycetota bacterium]
MRTLLTLLAFGALSLLVSRPLFTEPAVRAGTALRMDVPDLVEAADLVLEGRVLSATPVETEEGLIETEYELAVDRTFRGDDVFLRSVRLPGGVLEDGRGMLLAGVPHLREGEDALLFLSHAGPRGVRLPVGLAQGRYRIVTRLDGSKLAVRDQSDLGLVDPSTGDLLEADGLHIRDYAELVAEIEASMGSVRSQAQAGAPK